MKLSLCIATYNEEKFIHYPLDSCIDWVDEVVVVDGGSTDETVQILKSYGKKVKIFAEDNPPMFHINKQKAIDIAKGDWILQLDADEEVTQNLKNEILGIVNQESGIKNQGENHNSTPIKSGSKFIIHDSNQVAYWIPRKNFFLGRFLTKGGVYPDRTIRLYRNGVAKFPCKTVHENVTIDPMVISSSSSSLSDLGVDDLSEAEQSKAKSKDPTVILEGVKRDAIALLQHDDRQYIGYLKNDLLHYADPVFSRYLKRWNRYNDLDVRLLKDANKKVGLVDYVVVKPLVTFLSMYGRHKGFMDGWQGFVFAFFSSVRYIDIYLKTRK